MRAGFAPVAAAVASGLLLAAAQPGFDFSALAWIALVPLLIAVRGLAPSSAFRLGWISGSAYYAAILYWIAPTIATYTTIPMSVAIVLELLLAAVAGVSFGAVTAGVEWLCAGSSNARRVAAVPALWIVVEWSRTFFPAAFPWGFVGYTQARHALIAQAGDLAGIYGLSAWVVLFGAALAEIVRGDPRRRAALASGLALSFVVVLAYGWIRSAQLAGLEGRSARIGLVQANVDQAEKWRPGLEEALVARHVALTADAVEQGAELVIWPEASVPYYFGLDERTGQIRDVARELDVDLLVGAPGYEQRDPDAEPQQYNQAWLVRRDGELAGPYDKIRLVPFGEYVPWGGLFGLVDRVVEGMGDFGAGSAHVVFDARARDSEQPVRASALICYEAIFPDLTRRFVEAGAELLVNLSNDAWYGRTAAPHQLFTMIAFRAIENRVPLVRATNTGISGFVAVDGTLTGATPLFEATAAVADVELVRGFSLYVLLGDWLVYASLALLSLLAIARWRTPRY